MMEQATNQADGQQERTERMERMDQLRHLTKTNPDPQICRAQAMALVEDGETLTGVARIFHTAARRVQV